MGDGRGVGVGVATGVGRAVRAPSAPGVGVVGPGVGRWILGRVARLRARRTVAPAWERSGAGEDPPGPGSVPEGDGAVTTLVVVRRLRRADARV